MHPTSPTLHSIDAIVAATRAHARLSARLLRRLDPFREDPRIAAVGDLCAVLEGPDLLREDTVCAIEGLARLVADKLERAVRRDRPDPLREPLETLYGALLATVETARSLEAVLVADDAIGAGKAGM